MLQIYFLWFLCFSNGMILAIAIIDLLPIQITITSPWICPRSNKFFFSQMAWFDIFVAEIYSISAYDTRPCFSEFHETKEENTRYFWHRLNKLSSHCIHNLQALHFHFSKTHIPATISCTPYISQESLCCANMNLIY